MQAFVMSVDKGKEVEYERRHRPIWPELEAVLKEHGVKKCAAARGSSRRANLHCVCVFI